MLCIHKQLENFPQAEINKKLGALIDGTSNIAMSASSYVIKDFC